MMKIFCTFALAFIAATATMAQKVQDGISYFLPKTGVKVVLRIEKTTFTPGKLADYSDIYFKKPAQGSPSESYRIVGVDFCPFAVPDSAKRFEIVVDKKHSIVSMDCDDNGVLMAINAKAQPQARRSPFVPAPKPAPLNPEDFMSQDILSAGNISTMARLVAQEIYDIRDSRNQLSRGEADFMPKDSHAGIPGHHGEGHHGTGRLVCAGEGADEDAGVPFLAPFRTYRQGRPCRRSLLCRD